MKQSLKRFIIQTIDGIFLFAMPFLVQASCSLSGGSIHFGGYNVFDNYAKESSGVLEVNCDEVTSYSLKLSSGSGSFQSRYLQNGNDRLYYNVYIDASRKLIWGDGISDSSIKTAQHSGRVIHDIYGRIFPKQNVSVGVYSDVVLVTLEY